MRKRDQRAKIHFTPKKLAEVKRRAQAEGLDMSKYIRKKIAETDVIPAPKVDIPVLIRQVRLVGQRLDDILVRSRKTGFLDVPALRRALEQNAEAEAAIIAAYTSRGKEATARDYGNSWTE